jgi:hypothetical protein
VICTTCAHQLCGSCGARVRTCLDETNATNFETEVPNGLREGVARVVGKKDGMINKKKLEVDHAVDAAAPQ